MNFLTRAADFIDVLNEHIGRGVSWLTLAMGFVQFAIIVLLFLFDFGMLWMQEAILYMNGTLFMMALGWTFKQDGHVRVDIFYREMSPQKKARVNLVGIVCLLMPICLVMLWASLPYVFHSWQNLEGSRETGGIPALFLLKSVIPISAALLLAQAIAEAVRAVKAIRTI